jgi:hypothetical protein
MLVQSSASAHWSHRPDTRTRRNDLNRLVTKIALGVSLPAAMLLAPVASAEEEPPPSTPERELIQPGVALSGAAVYGDLVWTAGHLPDGVPADARSKIRSSRCSITSSELSERRTPGSTRC